jgi:Tfp pilus assembly protein PilO
VQIKSLPKLGLSSRQGLLAASVLIAVLAMYNWIVAPHVVYLRAVQRYEPVVAQVAQEQASVKDAMVEHKKVLEELEAQFGKVRSLLFSSGQVQPLTGDLEAMAVQHQCALTSVDFGSDRSLRIVGDDQGSLRVDEVRITVTVTGEYDGLMAFIGRVQAYERKIWVRALTMEPAGPEVRLLQCQIDIAIYVIQEKDDVPHD